MGNGNGGSDVIAKLAGVKERFMAEFQGHAARFRMNVQESREKFLNEIIELTMTDPNIAAVQKALDFFKPSKEDVVVVPASGPATLVAPPGPVEPAVAATLATPEAQAVPLKARKRAPTTCPNCKAAVEPAYNFCSRCAFPLREV